MIPDRDDELEAFLQRRSPLQQRFLEPDRLEPPAELDRIVLSRAREAIHAPEPEAVFRPARWALPFSLAAVLVLSFAVVLSLRLAEPQNAAFHVAELESAPSDPQTAEAVATAQPERAAKTSAPASAPPSPAARLAGTPGRPQETSKSLETKGAGQAVSLEEAARAERRLAIAPPEPTSFGGSAAEPDQSEAVVAMDRPRDQKAAGQAVSAEAAKRSSNAADEVRITGELYSALPRAREAPQLARSAPRAPDARAAPQARDPALWLKQIEQLRAERRLSEAHREWQAFRKAYPNHPRVRRTSESTSAGPASLADQPPPAEQSSSEPAR